jgi:hypothetical protein
MKRAILLGALLLLAGGYHLAVRNGYVHGSASTASDSGALSALPTVSLAASDSGDIARAYAAHRSGVQVHGTGIVAKVLKDDEEGSRHQRFILHMDSGQSVLFAHNIDLASRVPDLYAGERVEFEGEYEWNEKGGVVHWTHRDPSGRHPAGWLKVAGAVYR